METQSLLISIARCTERPKALTDVQHPCHGVVSCQHGDIHQVPEPWTGHIRSAPILFVASNPGIHEIEYFPSSTWSDGDTIDFFTKRFDRDAGYTVQKPNGGAQYGKVYGRDGAPVKTDHWVRFWSMVKNHATTILGRRPQPGTDYALTEMVHCKSNSEAGVAGALSHCSQKWMPSIMEHSPAAIVVLLGQHAHAVAAKLWNIDPARPVHFDVSIGRHSRAVALLPHTNYRGPRKIENCINQDDLERLRSLLSEE